MTIGDFNPEQGAKRRAVEGTTKPWQQVATRDATITRSFIDTQSRERANASVNEARCLLPLGKVGFSNGSCGVSFATALGLVMFTSVYEMYVGKQRSLL